MNRLFAMMIGLAIFGSVLFFAYGFDTNRLNHLFAYEPIGLTTKIFLGLAMIIITFLARPRWLGHKIILGFISTAVLGFATYTAFVSNLLIGDAILYAIGTMIAAFEATEIKMSRNKTAPELHLPATKSY